MLPEYRHPIICIKWFSKLSYNIGDSFMIKFWCYWKNIKHSSLFPPYSWHLIFSIVEMMFESKLHLNFVLHLYTWWRAQWNYRPAPSKYLIFPLHIQRIAEMLAEISWNSERPRGHICNLKRHQEIYHTSRTVFNWMTVEPAHRFSTEGKNMRRPWKENPCSYFNDI